MAGWLSPPGLAIDVLLLAIGDDARWRTRCAGEYAVGAAVTAQKVLAGQRLSDLTWERPVTALVMRNGDRTDDVAATCRAEGWIERRSGWRPWRAGPRCGMRVLSSSRLAAAGARLRDALGPTPPGDPAEAALGGLAVASGVAGWVVPMASTEHRDELLARLAVLERVAGPDVWAVVTALRGITVRSYPGSGGHQILPGRWAGPDPDPGMGFTGRSFV